MTDCGPRFCYLKPSRNGISTRFLISAGRATSVELQQERSTAPPAPPGLPIHIDVFDCDPVEVSLSADPTVSCDVMVRDPDERVPASIAWDFSEPGSTKTVQASDGESMASWKYASPGAYLIKVTAQFKGRSASATKKVTVTP